MVAGVLNGLLLGGAQALVLRRRGVVVLQWISASVIGGLTGCALLYLIAAKMGDANYREAALGTNLIVGGGLGFSFGAAIGALQSLGGGGLLSAKHWIAANMAGWAPAMAIIMAGAATVQPMQSLPFVALAGVIVGGIAGIVLGLVTSLALPASRSRPRQDDPTDQS